VENNIKDLKNGLDFHHFPCQSLKANHAWGLMGIIAYNLMRLTSFTISKNGCFVDSVRKNIVMKACEVIKTTMNYVHLIGDRIKEVAKTFSIRPEDQTPKKALTEISSSTSGQ
jgi:hypothetical protein